MTKPNVKGCVTNKVRRALPALAVALAISAPGAEAASLDLFLEDAGDILSGFMDVSYNGATDLLSASGIAFEYDDDGDNTTATKPISNGTFSLLAPIDSAGALSNGGTLTIRGDIGDGGGVQTLIAGDLTDFGFPPAGGDPLEFLFTPTSGSFKPVYYTGGKLGGVIMSSTAFPGSFSASWSNSGNGFADTAPVPLPAAVWLLGSGLLGLVSVARRG